MAVAVFLPLTQEADIPILNSACIALIGGLFFQVGETAAIEHDGRISEPTGDVQTLLV